MTPIPVPIMVDRAMVRPQLLNSAQVNRAPEIFRSADLIILDALRSIPMKISGKAKTPINIGRNGIPDSIEVNPNEKRDSAPMGSWPTMAKNRPTASISRPLTKTPLDVPEITINARKITAASSGGPINSATTAMGPIMAMVMMSLVRSPLTEANRAISSAFRPLPFLVKAGPSKVVATAAPVPGIDTRMAGMLPP